MGSQRVSLEDVEGFLAQERIAFVGVSRDPASFSAKLFEEFCRRGYDVVPVNPGAEEVLGRRCFARVQEIPTVVDAALLMTSPMVTEAVVRDCAEAGIRRVWMYRANGQGSVSSEAVQFCHERGIRVVPGECPFMFWPGVGAGHRLHGFIRKITGRYPHGTNVFVITPKTVVATAVSRTRRSIEVTAVVALWMALGIALHLGVRAYLLLGIPLTALFQWGIRRQPLRALWVRDAVPFRLDSTGWIIAALLAVAPAWQLLRDTHAKSPRTNQLFDLAALGGALAAAYALRNFRRAAIRPLLLCLAIAGGIGIAGMAAAGLHVGFAHRTLGQRLTIGIVNFLVMVPLGFVIEEVSFRGAFDAHVHHSGEPQGLLSALFVSALWGLWHVPVGLGQAPLLVLVLGLVAAHGAIGVPLSIYWRRSGNLIVPGSAHALIDAVRNALLILPWR